ncbi:Mitochondrial distribution and morphology protein 38, partial [Linum perenne]
AYCRKSIGAKRNAATPDLPNLGAEKLIFFPRNNAPGNLFSRGVSVRVLSSVAPSSYSDEIKTDNGVAVPEADNNRVEFSRVNCLVWVLHESAASFSHEVESLDLEKSVPELAFAWNGKDVHAWHKRIAHHVAVYALMRTIIEMELLLSHDRHSNGSPVKEILAPNMKLLGDYIESQLGAKHPELAEWFREVELPRVTGFFVPFLKKWSMEYAGSGVAGIILAISGCAAVRKVGSGKVSSPMLACSSENVLVELMDSSHNLVEVEKLHQLAIDAGFEHNFLSHFGSKILPCNKTEELEFWIGLAQKKLSVAFYDELIMKLTANSCSKVHADTLATLGLFAYLGRKTRLFLTKMGIKDLDEQLKDFLREIKVFLLCSYLECGSLFIYPEIGHVSNYQCFIEVVTDEIGWLEFYAASSSLSNQERKRSKQHAVQAEQEIILSTVFTVCYDVFSGFAHFSRSTQKPLDAELLEFLFRSQSLLAIFLEDYRAAYGRFGEPMKIGDSGGSDYVHPLEAKKLYKSSQKVEDKCAPSSELRKVRSRDETKPVTPSTKLKPSSPDMNILSKYRLKFMSKTVDVLMGTQLLVDDIMGALDLIGKQFRGQKISKREKKRLERTMKDVASLVPITILMLIPVSAVGHAAMLTAIQRYAPSLIPSPYSCDRLDMVKQLKRTKKLEVESWGILEDLSPGINREDTSYKRP